MDTIKINKKNVKMVAHRGVSGLERENTNAAFLAAANRSYYGIETDVHRTADGKFVLIHDASTNRVSMGNININVEKSTYEEISKIVFPDLDGSAVRQDIRIPLLSEYIAICKKYGKKCVLELKNSFTEEELVKITEEVNAADYADGMIYISFPLQNCLVLRRMLPDCEIQFLMDAEITEDTVKFLKDYRFDLDVHCRQLTKEKVELLHANGIKVNCWTCNTEEEANKLIEMGVDFITTNILE